MSTIQPGRLSTREELESVENSAKHRLECWDSRFGEIQSILSSKKWFIFDLDDTLHEFRKASSTALRVIISRISADYGTDVDEMQELYRLILAEKTAAAFTDGRTSREYRKERFQVLAQKLQLPCDCDDEYLNLLADMYEATLASSLCLKRGASSLLTSLKKLGKNIAIVTEGPEDAQLRTVQQLGLQDRVDVLATTNRFRTSKVDGLLSKVLKALCVSAQDVVYIGDSWSRDIKPAIQEGIYAIYYSETDNVDLDQSPVRVNTLSTVQFILEAEPVQHGRESPESNDPHF